MIRIIAVLLISFTLMASTVIDRDGSDNIKVYPQPIKGVTRISIDVDVQRIEIFNILGAKVLERIGDGDVDFTNLQPGYYLIKAQTEKGEMIKRVQKH